MEYVIVSELLMVMSGLSGVSVGWLGLHYY